MSTLWSGRNLSVIPYNIVVLIVFFLVIPMLVEPGITLLHEIPEYVFDFPIDRDQFILTEYPHSDHWYEAFGQEGYWDRVSGLVNNLLYYVLYIFALPSIGLITVLKYFKVSLDKITWIVMLAIVLFITLVIAYFVLYFITVVCDDNIGCELVNRFFTGTRN